MTTASTVEPLQLRSYLARFVTGVAIVSYRAEGEVRGLTVNSFTSVSLEPPLLLVSVARSARAADHLGGGPFSVNVLSATQRDLALQFAGQAQDCVEVRWQSTGDDLAPTLGGAIATFRCRPWQTYDGGDHLLHVGRILEADADDDGEPLLFDRGGFSDVDAVLRLPSADVPAAWSPDATGRILILAGAATSCSGHTTVGEARRPDRLPSGPHLPR